jgi:hypothetical protein
MLYLFAHMNLETLATMSTQDTGQRQTKQNTTQKTKKISNTDATKNPGVNPGAREGYAVLASYNTPAVLLI